jgi:hypothetical protein
MKLGLTALNDFFENLPDRLRRRRWLVLAVYLALIVGIGLGIGRITVDMTMEAFFAEGDPTRISYDRFKDNFGSDEWVYLVYEARDGDVFSDLSLNAVRRVQEAFAEAAPAPGSQDTSSLSHVVELKTILNADYLEVEGDLLRARDFIGPNPPGGAAAREKLRAQALAHRAYPTLYLSKDSRYGGMLIRTDFGTIPEEAAPIGDFAEQFAAIGQNAQGGREGEDGEPIRYKPTDLAEYAAFAHALEELLRRSGSETALRFYPVGNPVMMAVFEEIMTELELLLLGAMLMMLVVLLVLF